MTISELSHEQKIALVALMEAIAMANEEISEGEEEEIGIVAEAFGDDEYRKLLEEADLRFDDLESLKAFLVDIEDKDAQALIYGTVWEEAVADPDIRESESDLLEWLAETWNIPKPASGTDETA